MGHFHRLSNYRNHFKGQLGLCSFSVDGDVQKSKGILYIIESSSRSHVRFVISHSALFCFIISVDAMDSDLINILFRDNVIGIIDQPEL